MVANVSCGNCDGAALYALSTLFYFSPQNTADPNLLFVRKTWLVMQHYEHHKVSIWPGVIEHDGLHDPQILFCCVIDTFILLICWIFASLHLSLSVALQIRVANVSKI